MEPAKGCESVIEAMPEVIEAVPSACYVILGATEPNCLAREGDAYRAGLEGQVAALDLGQSVRFIDRFVGRVELGNWLEAADVIVTPYPNSTERSRPRFPMRWRRASRSSPPLMHTRWRCSPQKSAGWFRQAPRKRWPTQLSSSCATRRFEPPWDSGPTSAVGAWSGGRSVASTGAFRQGRARGCLNAPFACPTTHRGRSLSRSTHPITPNGVESGTLAASTVSGETQPVAPTGPMGPGSKCRDGTMTTSIAVSDTLQQRLPSARHMGAGPLSRSRRQRRPNPSRPARSDLASVDALRSNRLSFNNLGLSADLLATVAREGYTEPTPVQSAAIPFILDGRDVLAAAQTGTGKTAAFVLPILERLRNTANAGFSPARHPVRVLILTPTRELAVQIAEAVKTYGRSSALRSAVVYGGTRIDPEIKLLWRGVEILVATLAACSITSGSAP